MCGFCNVWVCVFVCVCVCVCVGFVMCGCVWVGFCNVWECVCVGFVMCAVCMCGFFNVFVFWSIHKLIISIWNKEELPEEWKGSIIVPIHKKADKTDCNNYRGISLLPTTYEILSNILLSRLIPYAEEVIGDHQCGFRSNKSTTDHIFCIRQILEKKWE